MLKTDQMEECMQCDPCNPAVDEEGRRYDCYACGNTGYVPINLEGYHETLENNS